MTSSSFRLSFRPAMIVFLIVFFVSIGSIGSSNVVAEEPSPELIRKILEAIAEKSKEDDKADAEKAGTEDAKKEEEKKADEPKTEEKKEEKKEESKESDKKTDEKKDESKKAEPKKEDEPDTLELKKEPLRLTVKLPGTFESAKAEIVRLKGEDFSTFELSEVVAHGSKVRKGDVLIKFNAKKYDEALVEKKRALRLSEISLQEEQIGLKYLEKRRPMQKSAMERSKKQSDEDFVYFLNVQQDLSKKSIAFQLKLGEFYVESAKEELKQLEKMYEADDLVEETEEFILKRSRFMADAEEFFFEMDKLRIDRSLNTLLPRMEESMRFMAKLEDLEYQKSVETFDFMLEQAKLRLEKAKETHTKLVEQYEKFVKDKQMLVLKAPVDGIVYYGEYSGKLTPGKWNNAANIAGAMKIDEMVMNKQVLFTIVDAKPSRVRTSVPEKELHWVKNGTEGNITPTAFPDSRYKVRITKRNEIPSPANDYVAVLSVELPENSRIYPNMSGSVELVVYDKKEALLIPNTSLKREENEDDSWNHAYVYVYGNNKKVDKIKVKTGNVKGDKTEVLSGVSTKAKVFKKFDDGEKWVEKEKEKAEKEKTEKEKKDK